MNQQQLLDSLRKTLEDFRLSRSERKSIHDLFSDLNERELQIVRSQIFALARGATVYPETAGVIDWLEEVTKLTSPNQPIGKTSTGEVLFSSQDDCSRRICTLLEMSQRSVEICVFTITDNRIRDAIQNAPDRKVSVRIISDNEKAQDIAP